MTPTLRVLYFIGSYGPEAMGTASHEETILALTARGHKVEVLTQVNRPDAPRFRREVYRAVTTFELNVAGAGGVLSRATRSLAGRFLQYEYVPLLVGALRRLLRRKKYDLIHAEGAYPFGLVAVVAAGRIPVLANVQGADVIDLPEADYGYRRFKLPRLAVALALKRARLIRAISPLLRDYLESEGLAQSDRVRVVLRALEAGAYPPQDEDLAEFRREGRRLLSDKHGIGLPRPVVVALSRLHPFKGLEYLVDAVPLVVARMRESGREVPWFVICGPSRKTEHFGDYREFLREQAQAEGVGQHVIFTGQVPHELVRHYLAGADVLACPSLIEAQNKVVPEACAVATPSVVTETTGITGYLAPEGACVPVPPRSAEAIADAIVRLLTDQEYYGRVQSNALRMAETLRAGEIAEQLERVWLEAALNKKQ
jgi:glycosyltransferase involved in cell wall biosynthesis